MNGSFASRNVGAVVKTVNGGGGRLIAAGTGDNTEVTGPTIDRAIAGGAMFLSAVVAFLASAVLTDTKKLKFGLKYQESADGSNWDTAVVIYASTDIITSAGGGAANGLKETDLDLSARKRYLRFLGTPDLDASGTDTAEWALAVTLGGADVTPV